MNRRGFLCGTGAFTLVGWKLDVVKQFIDQQQNESLYFANHLLQLVPRRFNASALGNAIIEELPIKPDVAYLVKQLVTKLPLYANRIKLPALDELRHRFSLRTSKDFYQGKVTFIDGWMLAETEAQLFSLAALHRS